MTQPQPIARIVHCDDAIVWLEKSSVLDGCSLVASLPDISEFPSYTLTQWKEWFVKTARLVLSRTPDDGVTIFYQSDIKIDGNWIDKSYLIQKAAEEDGKDLLWHKIICRVLPGNVTFGRPGYSHILCFSKKIRPDTQFASADVIPEIGEKIWERGMGIKACRMITRFIMQSTETRTIVNPFCGHGSMLAVANAFGLAAIGIERSTKRAHLARELLADDECNHWKKLSAD